jgi:hypothetical protein
MASHDTGFDDVFDSLRGIFSELFGTPWSSTSRADFPIDGSARAVLGSALEALRYYLDRLPHVPSHFEIRWFHARADEIFAEFKGRKS